MRRALSAPARLRRDSPSWFEPAGIRAGGRLDSCIALGWPAAEATPPRVRVEAVRWTEYRTAAGELRPLALVRAVDEEDGAPLEATRHLGGGAEGDVMLYVTARGGAVALKTLAADWTEEDVDGARLWSALALHKPALAALMVPVRVLRPAKGVRGARARARARHLAPDFARRAGRVHVHAGGGRQLGVAGAAGRGRRVPRGGRRGRGAGRAAGRRRVLLRPQAGERAVGAAARAGAPRVWRPRRPRARGCARYRDVPAAGVRERSLGGRGRPVRALGGRRAGDHADARPRPRAFVRRRPLGGAAHSDGGVRVGHAVRRCARTRARVFFFLFGF